MFIASLQDFFVFGLRHTYGFFHFWYVADTRNFGLRSLAILRGAEKEWGILVNLRLITQPIFGDYSTMGRVVGPVFRLGRVLLGAIWCLLLIGLLVVVFVARLILPPLVLYMIFANLGAVLLK